MSVLALGLSYWFVTGKLGARRNGGFDEDNVDWDDYEVHERCCAIILYILLDGLYLGVEILPLVNSSAIGNCLSLNTVQHAPKKLRMGRLLNAMRSRTEVFHTPKHR